jgi:hypothetical protein
MILMHSIIRRLLFELQRISKTKNYRNSNFECPIYAQEFFCLNGGKCYKLSSDLSTLHCNCIRPFGGYRCFHYQSDLVNNLATSSSINSISTTSSTSKTTETEYIHITEETSCTGEYELK